MDYSRIYNNGKYNSSILKENKWIKYLAITNAGNGRILPRSENETFSYVINSLEILDKMSLDEQIKFYVSQTLKWCEVSKCGTHLEKMYWKNKGYSLDIHNLASADIYMENSTDDPITTRIIYTLIKTHGLIGQNILGEVPLNKNYPLNVLIFEGIIEENTLRSILTTLNECVIAAKSTKIWNGCKEEVFQLIDTILKNNYVIEPPNSRIKKIKKSFGLSNELQTHENIINNIFSFCEMWFIGPVVNALDNDDIYKLFHEISIIPELNKVRYITFKPFGDLITANNSINIYTLRVIEKYLQHTEDMASLITPNFFIENMVLNIDFSLSAACKSLINFCIEAEKVGLLSFETAISLLFDVFNLKKDKFDRLNNEKDFLNTMNSITNKNESFKEEIKVQQAPKPIATPTPVPSPTPTPTTATKQQKPIPVKVVTPAPKVVVEPEIEIEMEMEITLDVDAEKLTTKEQISSTKLDILKYVKGKLIMDVGSGGGIMLDLLEKHFPDTTIEGTDLSNNVIKELTEKKSNENHKWNISNLNLTYDKPKGLKDTIVFSSILHEIFSYENYNNKLFNIDSVKNTLKNAYDSLNKGGRIIIRDGVLTDSDKNVVLKFNFKNEGLSTRTFFNNFLKDFRGLPEMKRIVTKIDDFTYSLNINLAREFLYTFTWGIKSYPHEVKEQFGYFTLNQYKEYLQSIGFKIIIVNSYLENGYKEHILPKVSIFDINNEPISLPDSTCFIVAEKM